jgi:5'-nucleotidase
MGHTLLRCAMALVALAFVGCETGDDLGDGPDDDFLVDGKTDVAGVEEATGEACGVLRVANEQTREVLDDDVRLDSRAANNIAAYRLGADGVAGTHDDGHFDSLAELDAVSYVGPVAFGKLLTYSRDHAFTCESIDLQVLLISDWHGQLDPNAVKNVGDVGGAAVLASYWQADRAHNPSTLVLSAGDSFGADPPLASYFEEAPVVESMNLMGVDAEAVGNHAFDRGTAHLQSMVDLADFPFLAANVTNVEDATGCDDDCIEPSQVFWVSGVPVAVVGLLTPDAASTLAPGRLGTLEVGDPAQAAIAARDDAAAEGARVFVALAHLGVNTVSPAAGPLVDLAAAAPGFDLVLGGHTHQDFNAEVGGTLLVETKSGSQTYARITLRYDFTTGTVTQRSAEIVTPQGTSTAATPPTVVMAPDQAVVDLLVPYRTQLSTALDVTIGTITAALARDGAVERTAEQPIGDLVADSIRVRYGTQLAFVNGGGIRAPLPSSYAPADRQLRRNATGYAAGPPYDLVLGDAYAVLPFGNLTVARTVTGAQLWQMLEHAVDSVPTPKGYFAQISGFRFTYSATAAAGSRVTAVTLADGTAIPNDGTTYTLATSDFLHSGGDGYTMLAGGDGQAQDNMAVVLADYIRSLGTVDVAVDGRITAQ